MIEERDANPTADPPGRFRGRRAPTALTAGGTESSEVVARLSGTESSNPLPSRRESIANLTAAYVAGGREHCPYTSSPCGTKASGQQDRVPRTGPYVRNLSQSST